MGIFTLQHTLLFKMRTHQYKALVTVVYISYNYIHITAAGKYGFLIHALQFKIPEGLALR